MQRLSAKTISDIPNVTRVNSESFSQRNHHGFRRSISAGFSNFSHLFLAQFCVVMCLSVTIAAATFFDAVIHIVLSCAEKQMSIEQTWRIVTIMEHLEPFRDFPVVKLPSEPMHHGIFPIPLHLAVTIAIHASSPDQTFSIPFSPGPKSGPKSCFEICIFDRSRFVQDLMSGHEADNTIMMFRKEG